MATKAVNVMSLELAEKEVNSWLDFKKVPEIRRDALGNQIEYMVQSFMNGSYIMDPETKVISVKLTFPIGNNGKIVSLDIKPRVTLEDKYTYGTINSGVPMQDLYNALCAASEKTPSLIMKLDHEDFLKMIPPVVFFQ